MQAGLSGMKKSSFTPETYKYKLAIDIFYKLEPINNEVIIQ